jgi:hypothetical protein
MKYQVTIFRIDVQKGLGQAKGGLIYNMQFFDVNLMLSGLHSFYGMSKFRFIIIIIIIKK